MLFRIQYEEGRKGENDPANENKSSYYVQSVAAPLWKVAMIRRVLNTIVSHVLLLGCLVNVDAATLSKRAKSSTRLKIQYEASLLSGKLYA